MDELTLLRGYDREAATPREEVLEASRRSLEVAMALAEQDSRAPADHRPHRAPRWRTSGRTRTLASASAARSTRPSRRSVLVGLGAVAATCTAVALLNLGGIPPEPASAAETLRAAAVAADSTDASVQGVTKHVQRFIASTLTDGGRSADGGPALIAETETLRPIRNGADWLSTTTAPRAVRAWGHDPQQVIDSINREATGPTSSYLSRTTPSAFWSGPDPARIRALPRDPAALLERLRQTPDEFGEARTSTDRAFLAASSILGSGLADSELQATTYRALNLLPDLRASRGADIDGREGVLISSPPKPGKDELSLIIDPSNGRFLGYAETHVTAINGAPAGTIEYAAAYSFGQ
jgi:hypothetical protein